MSSFLLKPATSGRNTQNPRTATALSALLASPPSVNVSEAPQALISELFASQHYDFTYARQYVAWRVTRRTAISLRLMGMDETLMEMTARDMSVWTRLHKMTDVSSWGHALRWDKNKIKELSLVPPGLLPAAASPSANPVGDPDPFEQFDQAELWSDLMKTTAQNLMPHGPSVDLSTQRKWIYGQQELFQYQTIDRAPQNVWPSPSDILATEEMETQRVVQLMVDHGTRRTGQILRSKEGLTSAEVKGLLELAREQMANDMYAGIEDERAMMKARLEDFINRAKANSDMRSELNALKQMSMVIGLTRGETEDPTREMGRVITEVSRGATAGALPDRSNDHSSNHSNMDDDDMDDED